MDRKIADLDEQIATLMALAKVEGEYARVATVAMAEAQLKHREARLRELARQAQEMAER